MVLKLFFATTIVVLCFTSSFVRSLQFLQSLRILIPFYSRRIIMLETPFPYLSSSLVGPCVLHKVCWCLSTRSGAAYFLFLLLSRLSLACGASREMSVSMLLSSLFFSRSDLSPSPHCLILLLITTYILRTYGSRSNASLSSQPPHL